MTFVKSTLALLALSAAFSPAFAAEADNAGQSPLAALAQKAGAPSLIEGRQAVVVAAPAAGSAAEAYLATRDRGEEH